jgi:hypothetical protein
MSNVNLQSDDNLDDNHIRTRLLGLEIENGHLNYGTIVKFKYEFNNHDTRMFAVTDKDNEIDVDQLLQLLFLIDCKKNGVQVVYPDGSDYSKRVFGPKRKHNAKAIVGSSYINPAHLIK